MCSRSHRATLGLNKEKKNQMVPEDECLNLAPQEQSWGWEMWEVFSSVTALCSCPAQVIQEGPKVCQSLSVPREIRAEKQLREGTKARSDRH